VVEGPEHAAVAGAPAGTAPLEAARDDEGAEAILPPVPLLLPPVRLETRFMPGSSGPELWLRVFPDQIHIDTHEPALTADEVAAAEAYWQAVWRAGTGHGAALLAPWQVIAAQLGPTRAAWVVNAHQPTNPGQQPPTPTPAGSALPVVPTFGAVSPADLRPASWSRAPRASGLPDRWTAAFVERYGRSRLIRFDNPVDRNLAVGPDPTASIQIDEADLQIGPELQWMVDFDAAVAAGMGQRIALIGSEAQLLSVVLVIGMPAAEPTTPADPPTATAGATGAAVLQALLDAHHYTDGLAFVPQGAPTNNTPDVPSYWSRQDPGYERSFAVERGAPLAPDDAARVADALGIDAAAFAHVEGADRHEQQDAQAMALAIWPASAGYFLRELLGPAVSPGGEELARGWLREWVRPRGPLPALRVGPQPYGLLPVTSLASWNPADPSAVESRLVEVLRQALNTWNTSSFAGPFVGKPGGDPDEHLTGLLSMDAASQSFRARHALGSEFIAYIAALLSVEGTDQQLAEEYQLVQPLLASYGITQDVRADYLSLSSKDGQVALPVVQEGPLSETEGLQTFTNPDGTTGNYISWLATAPVLDVREQVNYPGGTPPSSLLYNVLRQSVLLENAARAYEALHWSGAIPYLSGEEELRGFGPATERLTPWEALGSPVSGLTASGQSIADYLDANRGQPGPANVTGVQFDRLGDLYASLHALAGLPTAELERLFVETVDTFSHRLDPWVTSLATSALAQLEEAARRNIRLGGYGWVSPVLPADPGVPVSGPELAAVQQLDAEWQARHPGQPAPPPALAPRADNGGFVHAPSAAQAATAAVLRSGYLTNLDTTEGAQLAIDLSSERVNTALWLLDGVRQGQPLGALLGYRFETTLHEAGQDAYVQPFRNAFPLVANKLTQPTGPVEDVAASNVVDGLSLQRAASAPGGLSWPEALPGAVTEAVEGLLADYDAVADLSIAESVHQLVNGNHPRAGGILSAVSSGEWPPEPQVATTPRRGTTVLHRLALMLVGPPARAPGWPGGAGPRALAEPRLDAWLTTQLPANVSCTVTHGAPNGRLSETMGLADLELGPLDLLSITQAAAEPAASELDQRVLYAAQTAAGGALEDPQISYATPRAGDLDFPALLECARTAQELVAGARTLAPADLVEPERRAGADEFLRPDLSRLDAALAALSALADPDPAVGALPADAAALQASPGDPTAIANAQRDLLAASFFGAQGAVPQSLDGNALADQAGRVAAALWKRRQAVGALGALPATATPAQQRDRLVQGLRLVFGKGFTVLPEFAAMDGPGFATALAGSADLIAGGDAHERARWIQRLTHVRPAVARLDALDALAQVAARQPPLELELVQLPLVPAGASPLDRWVALAFGPGQRPPADGRVAFALVLPGTYDPAALHAGLVLDEWPERIPAAEESTGLAFHYGQPGARAPQALLLAVPPDPRQPWTEQGLVELLREIYAQARIRTVTLGTLAAGGQVLPMTYFAFNSAGDTVSFDGLVQFE